MGKQKKCCYKCRIGMGILLIVIAFLTLQFTVQAHEEKVKKVAWFYQPGYQEWTEKKEPCGYNYEYLMYISQYTGWKYEFVPTTSFGESYELLKNGEVDLLGYILQTPERLEEVDFPNYDCGTVATNLFVRSDSPLAAYDFEAFNGIKVACMESKNPLYLQEYAKTNNFEVELVYYKDVSSVIKAVMDKEVEAGVLAGYQTEEETRIVAKFEQKPFYFAVPKGEEETLKELNQALNLLSIDNSYYERDLAYKYLKEVKDIFRLTKEEMRYLEEKPVITVGYHTDWNPVEGKNETTGEFQGIVADVFERIEEITGITFEYIEIDNFENIVGKTDVIASFHQNFSVANENGYMLTNTFLSVPIAVVRKEDIRIKENKITAVYTHFFNKEENPQLKEEQTLYCNSIEACLDAVVEGRADEAFVNAYSAEYLLSQAEYNMLQANTLFNEAYQISVAVNKESDGLLCTILNKALHMISASDMNAYILKNTNVEPEITMKSIVEQMPMDVIFIALLILLFLILLFLILLLMFAITREHRHNKEIKKILFTDELTGVMNFRGFTEKAPRLLTTYYATHKYFIVDFDINYFEEYNTINGYQMGNELLNIVANRTKEQCSEKEICARIQADHFICLVLGSNVEVVCERAKEGLAEIRKQTGINSLLISYGVYEITDMKLNLNAMADCALIAKRTVKGNYEKYVAVYDENLHKQQLKHVEILNSFPNALKEGELVAYFQPKYDMITNQSVGAEALVRWVRKDGTMIFPDEFIPLLEANGLIAELDIYMFETICKKMSHHQIQGKEMPPIAVNVSKAQLYHPNFSEQLEALIKKYKISSSKIEIEVTETVFMENFHEMKNAIERLKEKGFLIAMDDFGSGFSSLNMLKDMPIDILKIDRGFLSTTTTTEKGGKILRNILNLAKDLELKTVAEGIETKEQLELLKEHGCDIAQGYYFSKPISEEAYDKLWDVHE